MKLDGIPITVLLQLISFVKKNERKQRDGVNQHVGGSSVTVLNDPRGKSSEARDIPAVQQL